MRTIILLFAIGGPVALAFFGAGVAARRTAQPPPRLRADQASASCLLREYSAHRPPMGRLHRVSPYQTRSLRTKPLAGRNSVEPFTMIET
jgi:hypothetical protein